MRQSRVHRDSIPQQARRPGRGRALALAAAMALTTATLLLGGCGSLPGLGGERDPTPPTRLDKKLVQRATPRVLWTTRIGKGTDGRELRLQPAVANGRVFAADPSGVVAALSPADGRVVWERKTRLPLSGGPDVQGDTLVVGSTDGDLLALSTRDGAQKWHARLDSEVVSIPRIIRDLVLVHTVDDTVYGFDLASGEERWRYNFPAPVLTLHGASSPVATPDGAIVGVSGGRLAELELERGLPLWEAVITPPRGRSELDRIADLDADPVVEGNTAYVATYNGDLAAVDVTTGDVLWRRELSAQAGLAADRDALYITDSDDNIWAANPADGAGLWRQEKLRYRKVTAPALVGDFLVVADLDGYVHLLSRRDGALLGFTRVTKAQIGHQPVVSGGVVYVYANNGVVAALRPTGSAAGGAAAQRAPQLGADQLPDLSPVVNPGLPPPAPSSEAPPADAEPPYPTSP
ncbi:MAG: outer membrane protein assembly factor BamB [Thiohalocapsa sp.]|uniref:outer membrane protein assembly factor BamB n=1 Tax=Thiohalocapsa sp. TaxID=2497641 RepID=UPI0025E547F9|nr:outer membrane protein assembly factor BamB [Thiohalocapsa sp.]MCG6940746.1 outer membrane protein assembly factor BamB [Thiohalocapsa sp.]